MKVSRSGLDESLALEMKAEEDAQAIPVIRIKTNALRFLEGRSISDPAIEITNMPIVSIVAMSGSENECKNLGEARGDAPTKPTLSLRKVRFCLASARFESSKSALR